MTSYGEKKERNDRFDWDMIGARELVGSDCSIEADVVGNKDAKVLRLAERLLLTHRGGGRQRSTEGGGEGEGVNEGRTRKEATRESGDTPADSSRRTARAPTMALQGVRISAGAGADVGWSECQCGILETAEMKIERVRSGGRRERKEG